MDPAQGQQNIHHHSIPVQPFDADNDSAFEDSEDLQSATTSLRSSITDFRYQNGRRYHAYRAGQYWGPNDEQQANQLDIAHHLFTLIQDDKLFLAPISEQPQRALDVGTGTGIWAIDFADLYPDCQVIGTDLSPTQPREVPPNLQFEVDDACSTWVYTKNSFDYVHMRGMYGSVSDWGKMYQEVLDHLKPGGTFEQQDTSVYLRSDDGTLPDDSAMAKWGKVSLEAGQAFGKSLGRVDENRQEMVNAGFEGVVEHRYKIPLGPWSTDRRMKEIGMYTRLMWDQGIEGWCMYLFTNYLGWQREEVLVFVAQMRRMIRDKRVHAYMTASVCYGRKPMSQGTTT